MAASFATQAQSVWVGGSTTNPFDWNQFDNWLPTGVPTANTDVIIPGGTADSPIISATYAVCKSLQVDATASLTIYSSQYLQVFGNLNNNGEIIQLLNGGTTTDNFTVILMGSGGANDMISNTGNMETVNLDVYVGAKYLLQSNLQVDSMRIESGLLPSFMFTPPILGADAEFRIQTNILKVRGGFRQQGLLDNGNGVLELKNGYNMIMNPATYSPGNGTFWVNDTITSGPDTLYVPGGITYNRIRVNSVLRSKLQIGYSKLSTTPAIGAVVANDFYLGSSLSAGLNGALTIQDTLQVGANVVLNPEGKTAGVYNTISLNGNWLHDGLFDATVGTIPGGGGVVQFTGTAPQTFSSPNKTGVARFYGLNINSGSSVAVLFNDIDSVAVSNQLNMTSGQLNIGNTNVDFLNTGQLSGESNTKKVFGSPGYLRAVQRTALLATNLAGFGATITSAASTSIEVRRYHQAYNVNGQQSILRAFDIVSVPDASLNATFQFGYFQSLLNGLKEDSLYLYRSTNNGQTWDLADCAKTNTTRDTAANYVQQTGINSFATKWTLAQDLKKPGGSISPKSASVCPGSPLLLSLNNFQGSQLQWQDSTGAHNFVDIAGATAPTLLISPTTISSYRVKVSNFSCVYYSDTARVKLNPANDAGTLSKNAKTVCPNDTAVIISNTKQSSGLQWQMSDDNITYNDVSSGSGGNTATYTTFNAPALSTPTVFYFRLLANNNICPSMASGTFTFTVNPKAVAGTLSASPTHICSGSTVTLDLTGNTGTAQFASSADSTSFSNIPGASSSPVDVTPTADTYYQAFVNNVYNCPDTSNKVFVRVDQSSVAGTPSPASLKDTICDGESSTLSIAGYRGTIQWQTSADNITFTDTLVNTPTLIAMPQGSRYYKVVVTNGLCSSTSLTFFILNPDFPSISPLMAAPTAICNGGFASLYPSTGVTAVSSYAWEQSGDNVTFVKMPGFNTETITVTPTVNTYYRLVATNIVCSTTSNSILLPVVYPAKTGTISATSDSICIGTQVNLSVIASKGAIQWQESGDKINFTDIAGASSTTLAVSPSSTIYYRVAVSNPECGTLFSAVQKVAVDPLSVAGNISAVQNPICYNTAVFLNLNGSTGAIQWKRSPKSGVNYNPIPGATTATLSRTLVDTTLFIATVKSGLCPAVSTPPYKVLVWPDVIAASDKDTICNGEQVKVYLSSYFPGLSIQWQESSDGLSFTDIPGQIMPSMFITPSQTRFYRAIVTNNPPPTCTKNISDPISVFVYPQGDAGLILGKNTECAGRAVNLSVANTVGRLQWQSSTDGINFKDTGPLDNTNTYTTPVLFSTMYYRVVAYSGNGRCDDISPVHVLNIAPAAFAGNITLETDSVCVGSKALLKVKNNIGSIQWQESFDDQSYIDIPGAVNQSISPMPLADTYYRLIASNGICSDTSAAFKVIVSQISIVGTLSSDVALCLGQSTILSLDFFRGKITYQDSSSSTTPVWRDSVNTDFPDFKFKPGFTTYYRTKVQSGVCPAVFSNKVQVYIYQASISGVAKVLDDTVCAGNKFTISLSNSLGHIQWSQSANGISNWTNLSSSDTLSTLSDTISVPRYYRAVLSNGTCSFVISNVVKVNVLTVASGTLVADKTEVCLGDSVSFTLSNYKGNIRWQYQDLGQSWKDFAGANLPTFIVGFNQNRSIRALVYNSDCQAISNQIDILVNAKPRPGYLEPLYQKICLNDTVRLDLRASFGFAQWQLSIDSLNYTTVPGGTSTYQIPAQVSGIYFYRVMLLQNGCRPAYTNTVKIEVLPRKASKAGQLFSSRTIEYASPTTIELIGYEGNPITWYSSKDSISFEIMEDAANTDKLTISPRENTYYLARVGLDPCFAYSNAIKLSVGEQVRFRVQPVPASDQIDMLFNLQKEQAIIIEITDAAGKIVLNEKMYAPEGLNVYNVNISSYASGIYFINIINNTDVLKTKFLKQ